jgi:predicted nucleic acid-binding protein
MAMMDAEAVFIDTNVLIYAAVEESPFCLRARGNLKRLERSSTELWISRQIIREFLAQMTRAPHPDFTPKDLLATLRNFEGRFCIAEDQALVTEQLVFLLEHVRAGGKQIHDANIVATMLTYNIPQLLTYNVDDFRRFSGLIQVISE